MMTIGTARRTIADEADDGDARSGVVAEGLGEPHSEPLHVKPQILQHVAGWFAATPGTHSVIPDPSTARHPLLLPPQSLPSPISSRLFAAVQDVAHYCCWDACIPRPEDARCRPSQEGVPHADGDEIALFCPHEGRQSGLCPLCQSTVFNVSVI